LVKSTPEGTLRLGCQRPPSSTACHGGGRSYGRGRSPSSARSSIGSDRPAATAGLVPESSRPCSTSSMSGSTRSNKRVS